MANIIPSDTSSTQLAEVADANFVVHASWALERTAGMRVVARREIVLTDCGLTCDTFNIACQTRLDANEAPRWIDAVIAFFRKARRPFSWWVGPADQPATLGNLLLDAGLMRADAELAMAADLATIRTDDLAPAGLGIHRIRTAQELGDFARVIANAQEHRFYERIADVALDSQSPQWRYVGYMHGQPVASAELTVGGGVVGLYNLATLPAYQRRGIGTALTLRPLLDARGTGFHTAVLQVAAAGVGVYERISFKPFGDITEYKPYADSPVVDPV